MSTISNKIQISAAVMLLLAGCGGGGGTSPKAVSASPAAPASSSSGAAATGTAVAEATNNTSAGTGGALQATDSAQASQASAAAAEASAQAAAAAAAAQQAAADKATAERLLAQQDATAKLAAEREAAAREAAQKAAAEQAAAERAAAQKVAEAQEASRRAAEAQRAAEQALEAERTAAAQRAAEEKAASERAEAERAAAERKAAEEKAKREAAEKAQQEAETKAKQEAEARARLEAEAKAKQEADRKAAEAAEKARQEAEAKAKEEADAKAKEDAAKAEEEARNRKPLAGPTDPWGPGGVNGAVLSTMLDQRTDEASTAAGRTAHAQAFPAVSKDGAMLPEPADTPSVISTQTRSALYTAEGQRPGALGTYSPATGNYAYTSHNGTSQRDGKDGGFSPNSVGVTLGIVSTDTEITFPVVLQAKDADNINIFNAPQFIASTPKVFRKTERVEFGKVVSEWKNGDEHVQLQLFTSGERQAYLCWRFKLPNTVRDYCNHWQVPDNWEAGQPLLHLGYYIEDKAGDKTYYWHTR